MKAHVKFGYSMPNRPRDIRLPPLYYERSTTTTRTDPTTIGQYAARWRFAKNGENAVYDGYDSRIYPERSLSENHEIVQAYRGQSATYTSRI